MNSPASTFQKKTNQNTDKGVSCPGEEPFAVAQVVDGQSRPLRNTSGETEGARSPWCCKFSSDIKYPLEMDN